MKKLICTVLGEFKSNDKTFDLTEEQHRLFFARNDPRAASIQNRLNHDPYHDTLHKTNYQLMGTNGDDLRKFIIHCYQEWHPDFTVRNEACCLDPLAVDTPDRDPSRPPFSPETYPSQEILTTSSLSPPFAKYNAIVVKVVERALKKKKREMALAARR